MTRQSPVIKRALLSVSDKNGIVKFAKALAEKNIEILSTGGTAKLLIDNNIPVIEVSDYTGFPEMMDGRVKTLHPKIHGGLLGRRGIDDEIMQAHGIKPIDLVVINLYPFQQAIVQPHCTLETAIENIDIGGPAMLRSSAKNHSTVTVIVDASDYEIVLKEMNENSRMVSAATRYKLAAKVFQHMAAYDGAIAHYLGNHTPEEGSDPFPAAINLQFYKIQDLRYGENPHQRAAFYRESKPQEPSVTTARQLQGKELSYNNIADSDAALECVKQFREPACVIVKHANPCGVALANSLSEAYDKAYQTDPTSAFGGIIAFNQLLDSDTALKIIEQQFVEVILAPKIPATTIEIVGRKKNIRLLETGEWSETLPAYDYKRVNGGFLLQDRDLGMITAKELQTVTKRIPSSQELNDLIFAWKVAKFVKSNAIVYCKNAQTIGIGAGQMSRIYSAKIAAIKAADQQLEIKGSVMASDAFFPFRDSIDAAHEAGITAIIQPGGSIRDEEVIQAADVYGIAMVFTGMRHFRH